MTRLTARSRARCLLLTLLALPTAALADIDVDIEGVGDSLEDDIRSSIALTRPTLTENVTPAYVRSLYTRSISEIREVLRSNGYYNFTIDNSLRREDEDWVAEFNIDPGEPVIIESIDIDITGEGRNDIPLYRIANNFPLEVGDRLEHGEYEAGKRQLFNIARERGYFDADFATAVIRIGEDQLTADIQLEFDTGVRYRFGEIILPDTVVRRERLNNLTPFNEGDRYDVNLLIEFSRNLRESNYFDEVVVTPLVDEVSDHRVPVSVSLTPKPKNSISVGLGYGTDSGPRLVGAWDSNYFNRRGHRLETDLKLSPRISMLHGSFLIPDFRRRGPELGLLASLTREDTPSHLSNVFKFGAQHLQTRGVWTETVSLSYQFEGYTVAGVEDTSNLLIPGLAYGRIVSNSPIYTNDGYRLNLSLRGSVRGALSSATFLQAIFGAKHIISAGEDGRFVSRAEVGTTLVPRLQRLPASIRFFAGGDNSIRGHALQALGPTNEEGEVIGGRHLAVGSVAYEHRIMERFSAAVFTDFGNAFNNSSDHVAYSAGVGVRWLTPVGLIRVDFAFGLSEDPVTFRLHVNVGPDL